MHYYQFNIGDYIKSTRHLSNLEDLAYRRLLDLSYDTEKPLIENIQKLSRLIGFKNNPEITQAILEEYFILSKNGWCQKRVKKELSKYASKASTARANGKLGGRPKLTQLVNLANPELTKSKAKHKTINIKHKPIKKNSQFTPPFVYDVAQYCHQRNNKVDPQDFIDHYESNGWMRGKTKIKDWKACVRTWEKNANEKANGNSRYNQTPTDRSRIAGDELRRQEAAYPQDSTPVQINDRLIR